MNTIQALKRIFEQEKQKLKMKTTINYSQKKGFVLIYDTEVLFNEMYSENGFVIVFDNKELAFKKAHELIDKNIITEYGVYSAGNTEKPFLSSQL